MNKIAQRGFTLAEILIVVVILGVVAKVAIPFLSSNNPQKLNVAAEETANFLRYALSEAKRNPAAYVLIDGKTNAGQLALYKSDVSANLTLAIDDPLNKKRPAIINVSNSAFSQGVTLTPQFRAGGNPQSQLLIDYATGVLRMQGFNGVGAAQGLLQANGGVLLSLGAQSVTVRINEVTGLVTLP